MVGFVILHYQTIKDTLESINSIKKSAGTNDYVIIVIDNASFNNTGVELMKMFAMDPRVKIVCNKENLGFAKGNNTGYMIAKYEYGADFIIMMNNDVNIITKNIISRIKEIYKNEKYAVLGPMILSADGRCDSNPVSLKMKTKKEVEDNIRFYKKMERYLCFHLEQPHRIFCKLRNLFFNENFVKRTDFLQEHRKVKLHGCFWVFSPLYVEKYDGIDGSTFMYMEEDILQFHMAKENMLMLYSPEIMVYHKEGISSSSGVTDRQKLIRKYKWLIESNIIFLNLLEQE